MQKVKIKFMKLVSNHPKNDASFRYLITFSTSKDALNRPVVWKDHRPYKDGKPCTFFYSHKGTDYKQILNDLENWF